MKCAICQPHYLPWIGYFEMIDRVDTFVFLDDVQFVRREWKNRNRIRKTADGTETKWLTVPIVKQPRESLILNTLVSEEINWSANHLSAVKEVYRRSPGFEKHFPLLVSVLQPEPGETIADLNIRTTKQICAYLGIRTRMVRSSELHQCGKREERLRNICIDLGANAYLANNATASYVPQGYFEEMGIRMEVQEYSHPVYRQQSGKNELQFLSHLSIVDLLMNTSREETANAILLSGRKIGRGSVTGLPVAPAFAVH